MYLRKSGPGMSKNADRRELTNEEDEDIGNVSDPELHTAERSRPQQWAVKRTLERPKSAKGVRSELSQSMGERQFKDFLIAKTKKQSNRKITVPKPNNFEQREKTRPKTIAQKKFEEYMESKELEILELQKPFKAKEVPPDVTIPK